MLRAYRQEGKGTSADLNSSLGEGRHATKGHLDFAIQNNENLVEIVAVWRRASAGRNVHVDRSESSALATKVRPKGEVLKNHPELAALGTSGRYSNFTFGGRNETRQEPENCGFPAARRTMEDDSLAGFNAE